MVSLKARRSRLSASGCVTVFFPNEAIDIYDGQVDAWEDTNQDAPEEQKEAPDMERSA